MKRFNKVLAWMVLAAGAPVAVAQHSGHGGATSGGGSGNQRTDAPLSDFKRTLALQATAEQRVAFANCQEATERTRNAVNQMIRSGSFLAPRHDAFNFSTPKETLEAALADMDAAHRRFRQTLTEVQEKEFGKSLKKLDRFNAEMGSRFARVARELAASQPDTRRIEGDVRKIQDAADKWRSEHSKMAKEMGISG